MVAVLLFVLLVRSHVEKRPAKPENRPFLPISYTIGIHFCQSRNPSWVQSPNTLEDLGWPSSSITENTSQQSDILLRSRYLSDVYFFLTGNYEIKNEHINVGFH